MKWWLGLAAGSMLSSAAAAGSYRVVLEPRDGKILTGHAGVQAVDDWTPLAHVRLVTPGNAVDQRGTIRVLAMNLGSKTFELGPDQVRVTLADGTVLQPSSVDQFEKGRLLVERESRIAGATDMRTRNNLPGLEQQANGGASIPVPGVAAPGSSSASGTAGEDRRTDESLLPGAETLNAIYQILVAQPVAPKQAWGGYYVFDVPKPVLARRADQPLSITVRTGAEEHRFSAVLKWKP
jgi:hypothetical protein